eukprot:Nitzschia sp. Nitz4//scaffold176_size46146//650//1330//NITZ4_007185-RA/size46146-processed-gene-0.59-mRNA-1//-1//CDS//3329538994//5834//frame0
MVAEDTPLQGGEATFRTADRTSNVRSNIFILESVVVLTLYIVAIYTHAHALTTCGIVYMCRLNIMSRWLLKRELAMEEITFVILLWIPGIMASYVFLSKDVSNIQIVLALLLYVLGSYLNTWSELQRKIWKQDPQNKGRCYTLGLFSLSRNINYFGDTVLFTGWALVAGNWWNAWAPIMMALSFYFHHIPDKEKYLAERYAADWPAYLEKTPAAFIPWIL